MSLAVKRRRVMGTDFIGLVFEYTQAKWKRENRAYAHFVVGESICHKQLPVRQYSQGGILLFADTVVGGSILLEGCCVAHSG